MTDWRDNLSAFFEKDEGAKHREEKSEMAIFIEDVILPAFQELESELAKHGRFTNVRDTINSAALTVYGTGGEEELMYRVQGRTFPTGVLPYAEIRFKERKGLRLITAESMFRSGSGDYCMQDIFKEEVIQHFIENYTKRVQQG